MRSKEMERIIKRRCEAQENLPLVNIWTKARILYLVKRHDRFSNQLTLIKGKEKKKEFIKEEWKKSQMEISTCKEKWEEKKWIHYKRMYPDIDSLA